MTKAIKKMHELFKFMHEMLTEVVQSLSQIHLVHFDGLGIHHISSRLGQLSLAHVHGRLSSS